MTEASELRPLFIGLSIVGAYLGLFLYSQLAWGIVTFVLFLFGSGYGTARFLFDVEERLLARACPENESDH